MIAFIATMLFWAIVCAVLALVSLRRAQIEAEKHEQRAAYARQRAQMMNRYGRTASRL